MGRYFSEVRWHRFASSVGRRERVLWLSDLWEIDLEEGGVRCDDSVRLVLGFLVPATVHVPDKCVGATVVFPLRRGSTPDPLVTHIRDSVPIHRNLLLISVKFIEDHFSILDPPSLHLLLSDARGMFIVVEHGLLYRDLDTGGHKVQALV